MIRDGETFYELGADYYKKRNSNRIINNSVKKIESFGYKVILEESEKTA